MVQLAVFVLLARLLTPEDFGLVAMAGIYIHISTIIADQGLVAAVIQRRELHRKHTDSAFWLCIAFGALLTSLGLAAASPIANLFREPELKLIIALLSTIFVINSLAGVQSALLTRRFAFKLLAVRSFGSTLVGGLVAVVMATKGFGVMALVAQQVVTAAVGVILLWTVSDWRPRVRFSVSHARDLLTFGYNVAGIRVVNAFVRRSDDALIGFFLGASALGYYAIAYKLFKMSVDVITKVISQVALPAFAALQADIVRLRNGFCTALSISAIITFPVFATLGILAGDIIPTVFGDQWNPSVPVMHVLAFMGGVQAVHLLTNQLLIGAGRPSVALRLIFFNGVITLGAFVVVVQWGIVAVAAAYTIVGYIFLPLYAHVIGEVLELSARSLAKQLITPTVAVLVLIGTIVSVRSGISDVMAPLWAVTTIAFVGMAAYLLTVVVMDPRLPRRLLAGFGPLHDSH